MSFVLVAKGKKVCEKKTVVFGYKTKKRYKIIRKMLTFLEKVLY